MPQKKLWGRRVIRNFRKHDSSWTSFSSLKNVSINTYLLFNVSNCGPVIGFEVFTLI
jgi:hypothetical protein